jgi:multicomponent Na+:H+ antiporter subunit G
MMLTTILVALLLISGTFFIVVASIGVIRMPDVFLRLSATSKAATLGILCMLGGAAVYFGDIDIVLRTLAIAVFLTITTPIAAHMIGRAALSDKDTVLWEGTIINERKRKP